VACNTTDCYSEALYKLQNVSTPQSSREILQCVVVLEHCLGRRGFSVRAWSKPLVFVVKTAWLCGQNQLLCCSFCQQSVKFRIGFHQVVAGQSLSNGFCVVAICLFGTSVQIYVWTFILHCENSSVIIGLYPTHFEIFPMFGKCVKCIWRYPSFARDLETNKLITSWVKIFWKGHAPLNNLIANTRSL